MDSTLEAGSLKLEAAAARPSLTASDAPVEYRCGSLLKGRPQGSALNRITIAIVAELADAHGSGPCTRKGVGVRVPSSAPAF